jgi:hypothetical protein
MKLATIAVASVVIFSSSLALAQNASTGSTTTSGDSAVSPPTGSPMGTNRPSPGAGINSGAMNNGTTGDTIGTGPGTSAGPSAGTTTSAPAVRKE